MIDISKGRYWDEGIQLVDGCTPCSPGCDHCWSAGMTRRLKDNIPDEFGFTHHLTHNGIFNGKISLNPWFLKRFNTHKPKVFAIWNDLFHEDVPESFLDDTFMTINANIKNIYLLLTKRPVYMRNYLRQISEDFLINAPIYFGLTVCNQQEANEKIPIFLQVPGKKFLSIEPMLGPIDLSRDCIEDKYHGGIPMICCFDAVILGGETGHGARPLHPDWVRSVRDQCAAAGVPFFFKQWGEYIPIDDDKTGGHKHLTLIGKQWVDRVGRKKAGRELDGCFHDDLPWVK